MANCFDVRSLRSIVASAEITHTAAAVAGTRSGISASGNPISAGERCGYELLTIQFTFSARSLASGVEGPSLFSPPGYWAKSTTSPDQISPSLPRATLGSMQYAQNDSLLPADSMIQGKSEALCTPLVVFPSKSNLISLPLGAALSLLYRACAPTIWALAVAGTVNEPNNSASADIKATNTPHLCLLLDRTIKLKPFLSEFRMPRLRTAQQLSPPMK